MIFSNIFNFVVGFNGGAVSPVGVMPCIRPALVDIFVGGVPPWTALCAAIGAYPKALGHTPIVYIGQNGQRRAEGFRVVESHAQGNPWGFTARCNNPICKAGDGNVRGRESKHTKRFGVHGSIRFKCDSCGFGVYVIRPTWITPIGGHNQYIFYTPWPLTIKQVHLAIGLDQTWALASQGNAAQHGARHGTRGEKGVAKRKWMAEL